MTAEAKLRDALAQIAEADFASMEGVGSPFGLAVRERAAQALEEADCTCGVSAPDEFGNRDLFEDDACPLHGGAA